MIQLVRGGMHLRKLCNACSRPCPSCARLEPDHCSGTNPPHYNWQNIAEQTAEHRMSRAL